MLSGSIHAAIVALVYVSYSMYKYILAMSSFKIMLSIFIPKLVRRDTDPMIHQLSGGEVSEKGRDYRDWQNLSKVELYTVRG